MPSFTIGVLSTYFEGNYYGGLLAGIQQAIHRSGGQVIAIRMDDSLETASRDHDSLLAWAHIDGWIALTNAVNSEFMSSLKQTDKPLVTLSTSVPGYPAVMPNNHVGTAAAVHHLIDHGHKRIAFVGNISQPDLQQRFEGYQAALRERGIAYDPQLFLSTPDLIEAGGREAAQELIKRDMPCTAVVAGTDLSAIGVMEEVQAAGWHVPNDLAIVGFDDLPVAQQMQPPLSSVRQPLDMLGQAAVDRLVAHFQGSPLTPETILVPTLLVQRQSCGCAGLNRSILQDFVAGEAEAAWDEQLQRQLVSAALYPQPMPAGATPEEVWPGVQTVVQGLRAALEGAEGPAMVELAQAWQQAFPLIKSSQVAETLLALLRKAAQRQLALLEADARVAARVQAFLDQTRTDQAYAGQSLEMRRSNQLDRIIASNYEVVVALAGAGSGNAKSLDWLYYTPVRWACLGLWRDNQAESRAELEVVGGYAWNKDALPRIGTRWPIQEFPPRQFLEGGNADEDAHLLMLLPLKTAAKEWGVLALLGPIETAFVAGRGTMVQWATLLSAQIEREALAESLVEQQESLRQAYEEARALADTVRELGSPILPLLPGVLLIPLIGALDTNRTQLFMDAMLREIVAHRATVILLDITGVPVVDTQVANSLIQATQAATLLGARTILVGIRPEIAMSIVGLGIDLRSVATEQSLGAALQSLLGQSSQLALQDRSKLLKTR